MNTKSYYSTTRYVLAFMVLLQAANIKAATLFENFDNPSVASTNNNGVTITYPSGAWFTNGITKPTTATENDRIIGLYSMRMRGLDGKNLLQMNFDKAGAGVLSFKYGSYSNHQNGEFTIQQSTDGGTNWTTTGTPVIIPVWSGTFLTYTLPVNYNGNIRFRLVVTLRTPNNANEQFNVDDWMITDYGTEQVAMPVSSVPTGVYETAQTAALTSSTASATIYYTTDGTTPTTTSSVYTTPLKINATTKIRAYAVAAGKVDSREETIIINIAEQIATLAEFYTKMAVSGTNLTYFKYTGAAVVTTSYTATYKTIFLQDNTAGIIITDFYKKVNNNYVAGDKITGIIAQVNRINDSPQLYPNGDFTVTSNGNSVTPAVITLADVPNRTYQLVQINDLYFDEANGTKTFSPNTPYVIHDASTATTTTTFRTPSSMPNPDYISTVIPSKRNIICLIAKNSATFSTHYIFARNAADLDVKTTGLSLIKNKMINLAVSGNQIIFETTTREIVKVYSFNGQLIRSFVSEAGKNRVELSKGVYIIRVGDKTAKVLL